ncbi:hypothetical protein O3796_00530 [Granulicatella adiacens]|jgi:hypothetical protein|uniref:hypothetical protein n=1 Tax=Granulicatella adiacens TaxID=46124 RepID=UPI00352DBC26
MEKNELISEAIMVQQLKLEQLEEKYRSNSRELENQQNELFLRKNKLLRYLEEIDQMTYQYILQSDIDVTEDLSRLRYFSNSLFDDIMVTYTENRIKLDEKKVALDNNYKKEKKNIDSEIELIYSKRRNYS